MAQASVSPCLVLAGLVLFIAMVWIGMRRNRSDRRLGLHLSWMAGVFLAYFLWGHLFSIRRNVAMEGLFPQDGPHATRIELTGVVGSDIEFQPLKNGGLRCSFLLSEIRPADGLAENEAAPIRNLARRGAPSLRVVWFGHRPGKTEVRPIPQAGDRWQFRGKINLVGKIPARQTIKLTSRREDSRLLARAAHGNWRSVVAAMRAESSRRLSLGMEGRKWRDASAMIQAILLGYRHDIPYRLNQVFRDSGTMHVFAISGMHVMIVAGFLTTLLGWIGLPRTRWFLVVCPALVVYTAITGAQPSALRACLMTCLYLIAPLFGRRPDGASALSIAALVLLAWNPGQISNAGFLLSFTVVAGLIALATPLTRLFRRLPFAERLAENDRLLWRQGGDVPAFARWRARLLHGSYDYVANLLAVSIVAWVTSAPLTAWYFQRLTPVAILANLAIVPLAMVVVVGGCSSLVAASIATPLAMVVNRIPALAAELMAQVAHASSSISWLVCKVPKPPEWMVGAWYFLLVLAAWHIRTRNPADERSLPY
ncbi:MAG: ComEC/Rec2 family competence protein [Kiritimatiellia bacterium]|jgi:ComEC/Rec2-related protein